MQSGETKAKELVVRVRQEKPYEKARKITCWAKHASGGLVKRPVLQPPSRCLPFSLLGVQISENRITGYSLLTQLYTHLTICVKYMHE